MASQIYAPVTIGSLRRAGRVLEVHCNACARFVELDAMALPFADVCGGADSGQADGVLCVRQSQCHDEAAGRRDDGCGTSGSCVGAAG